MTVKITRNDMTAQDLRAAAGSVKDGKVAPRLLAVALVLQLDFVHYTASAVNNHQPYDFE